MIIIEDLLRPDRRWREYASQPEMDPLMEDDALQEAQLLDVRFDAMRSTVGLLFEPRLALQLREANTGATHRARGAGAGVGRREAIV